MIHSSAIMRIVRTVDPCDSGKKKFRGFENRGPLVQQNCFHYNRFVHFSIERTLEAAPNVLDSFRQRIGDVGREKRGVHVHEAFFIFATAWHLFQSSSTRPQQILESGRARGQSTLLLARCFPDTPLISIEFNEEHPDAPMALEKLKPYRNVSCRFGDATRMLPDLVRPGDLVIIDGPKGVRGLRTAISALQRGARIVFLHDCSRDSRIRPLIEKQIPHAFFSDDPRFIEAYAHLNRYMPEKKLKRWEQATRHEPKVSYGGTFACIPLLEGFPSMTDRFKLRVATWMYKRRRSLRKRGIGSSR